MKKSLIVLPALAATFMVSCTTVRETARTESVTAGVCQHPTVADLEVKGRTSRTVEWKRSFLGIGQPSLEERKNSLVAEIIRQNGADVLLEPQVEYVPRFLRKRTLVVTGYPASFKNFRKATKEDLEVLKQHASPLKTKIYDVSQPWYKKIISPFKN